MCLLQLVEDETLLALKYCLKLMDIHYFLLFIFYCGGSIYINCTFALSNILKENIASHIDKSNKVDI